jgi:hypothetical protein
MFMLLTNELNCPRAFCEGQFEKTFLSADFLSANRAVTVRQQWQRHWRSEKAILTQISLLFSDLLTAHEPQPSFVVSSHLWTILPLLGERAGVRAGFLQPRHEALIGSWGSFGREHSIGSWEASTIPKSRISAMNRLANGARLCVRSTPAAALGMEEGHSCFQASVV